MKKVDVKWDASNLSEIMRSEQVQAALLERAEKQAEVCDGRAREHLHSPMREMLYDAEVHVLRNTSVAVVHASNYAGANINRKHGTLQW